MSPLRQQSPLQQQPPPQTKNAQTPLRQKTKIPMLIANHNNRSSNFANNDSTVNENQNSNSILHPIYNQQMRGVTPTVFNVANGSGNSQHSKMNLCGYDSFLHAKICGGGGGRLNQTSPCNTPTSHNQQIPMLNSHHNAHQQVATATVQPSISSFVINSQSNTSNQIGLVMSPNSINLSKPGKIMNNVSHTQTCHATTAASQNSPQYHGYQRLPSSSKNHLSPFNFIEHGSDKLQNEKIRSVVHMQNYDLYAKLTEKLQQTSLAASNRESVQRRNKHRVQRHHRRSNATVSHNSKVCVSSAPVSTIKNLEYNNLISYCEDPMEFQNLIAQTSDDESHSQHHGVTVANEDNQNVSNISTNTRNVAEGNLVDLEEVDAAEPPNVVKYGISSNILATDSKIDNPHLEDELELDDELGEDLADLEEIAITESGRNSSISNEGNEATIANTNNVGANTSLIHRYVHEHIHHHYHHFEDKEE